MSTKPVNAAEFFIRNEAGKVTAAGFIQFERRDHHSVQTIINVLKDEAVTNMVKTMPPGGYYVTDRMSGGRIELVTADIENLRGHFDVPLSQECKAEADRLRSQKTIAFKPNPVKS